MGDFDPAEAYRELERRQGAERALLDLQTRMHTLERVRALERRLASHDGPRAHLVIGDSHANPEVGRDHYRWLGQMVADLQPEVVVDIGDWFDMDSLNPYDKGKKAFEGRRYWRDIEAGVEAQELFREGLGGYAPELIRTLGNHENRINKVREYEPQFGDLIGIGDLKSEEYGWNVVPFLMPVCVAGTYFCHYLEKRGSNRAISGVVPSRNILQAAHRSIVVGHSHVRSYYEETAIDGTRILSLNAACYFPQHMAYAGRDNALFGRGLHVLRNMEGGVFETEWRDLDTIRRRYA
jgi:hypothetical protein